MKKKKIQKEKREAPPKAPFKFYLITALIPIAFFLILEGALWVFGFGHDYSLFITSQRYNPQMLGQNPDIAHKYFDNLGRPNIQPDGFYKEKPAKSFRIFVLGASSAAGFPYYKNGSFAAYLQRKLDLLYPDITIEIVNLGHTAINSYTLADYMGETLSREPDLILIYAGHNEYYGALGVGSSNSLGNSRFIKKFNLKLRETKITELIRNLLGSFSPPESSKKEMATGGLRIKAVNMMERMVEESFIEYESGLFSDGLAQFESNLKQMFEEAQEAGVPVVIGSIVSNLKGQKPFIAESRPEYEKAVKFYEEAQKHYKKGDYSKAQELFIKAKEYDGVRFRAPEGINGIIKRLGGEFSIPVAGVYGAFAENSPNGIIGDELIIDHLHPNYRGYQLVGEAFFRKMAEEGLLPGPLPPSADIAMADSIIKRRYPLSELDSIQVNIMMKILKGSYPYVKKGEPNKLLQSFTPKTFLDSAALFYKGEGRALVAAWYLQNGNHERFKNEIYILAESAPFNEKPFESAMEELKRHNLYSLSFPYLLQALGEMKENESIRKWQSGIRHDLAAMEAQGQPGAGSANVAGADSALYYYNLGKENLRQKKGAEALAALNKSIFLDSAHYDTYIQRAFVYSALLDSSEKALESLYRAISLRKDFIEAYVNAGFILINLGRNREAVEFLEQAIEINESIANAHYLLGHARYNLGEEESACAQWQKAAGLGFAKALEAFEAYCN